jgi:ABC-type uncharacterized transport system substrate-binding protein
MTYSYGGSALQKGADVKTSYTLFLLFGLLLLLPSDDAGAQINTYRVGILTLINPNRPQLQGFRDGLKEFGYIEGQNLRLEMPNVRTPEELRLLAKDYVRRKVNVIVTTGTFETAVAKETTSQLPIVFMPVSDPINAGFVKSFRQPGTNLTGLALMRDVDSYGKQLEVFKEAIPSLGRIAVIYDGRGENPLAEKGMTQLKKVAFHRHIVLYERPIREIRDAEQAVASLSKSVVDGIFFMCSSLFGGGFERILTLATEKKLPLFSCGWTRQGGLISLSLDLYQVGRRAVWYVDQIRKGLKPQDIAVEVPLKYELAINLRTAEKIGIEIPPEIRQRADEVIK